ncbi:MAG TPA: alpha/beta hydrolase, partial [Puia sp.]|nr:alpha/beta hydrolase [Puia sp.]
LPALPQMKAIRYKDEVFPSIAVEKNLCYSPGDPVSAHRFDWYEPQNDSTLTRPLVIWMHGGGFRFGSKNMKSIRIWCRFFARRGYVCAAINYRLGKKSLNFGFDDLVKNCYQALGDVRLAIAWFKANAIRLRIDTSRIILAGNSAGGMLALQVAYGTDAALLQLLHNPDSASASHHVDPGRIAAVINFWGGIFDTAWLRNARVPIVSVHGTEDPIMPYGHKSFPLFGSGDIQRVAGSLGIPSRLKKYPGYSHELQKHFNPLIVTASTRRRQLEAAQFAADFIAAELFGEAGGGMPAEGSR